MFDKQDKHKDSMSGDEKWNQGEKAEQTVSSRIKVTDAMRNLLLATFVVLLYASIPAGRRIIRLNSATSKTVLSYWSAENQLRKCIRVEYTD